MAGLDGRVAKLERVAGGRLAYDTCRGCGLRHVQPLSLADVRGIIGGPIGKCIAEEVARWRREHPHPGLLCLCDCCAADRRIAELSRRTYVG